MFFSANKKLSFLTLFLYLIFIFFIIYFFIYFSSIYLKLLFAFLYLVSFVVYFYIVLNLYKFNIKKQKADDLQLNLLIKALNTSSEHIVVTDKFGTIIFANKAVEKITGYPIKEIIGKKAGSKNTWGGVMSKEFYSKFWKKIGSGKVFKGVIKNKKKSGAFYDAGVVVTPIYVFGKRYYVGIEHNLSYEKALEKMKTDFISLASHQLRTPLSAMKWYLEMLLDGDAGPINDEQKSFLQNINGSNERMIELINSLLSISRVESGRLIVEPKITNLINLIEDVITDVKPKAKEKGLTFIFKGVPELPSIYTDPHLLRNVYMNLLTNAIKYTKKGGMVSLIVKKTDTHIVNIVEDTGIGIPSGEQKKIFTRFFRASNARDLVTDGNGLGLYLVKSVIEVLKGDISFKSLSGKGTTFTFKVPIKGVMPKKGEVTIDT